jgi:dihydrolipoamide dehydrogenase
VAAQVDLLVIGAGPGGYVAAIRAAQLGLKTLLVDKDYRLGGECLNYGCIPSKALIFTANLVHKLRHAEEMGVEFTDLRVDMNKLQKWRAYVIERLNRGIEQLCQANGVQVLYGAASFVDPHRVRVEGAPTPDGSTPPAEEVSAEKIIVATGSTPMDLPAFRFDRQTILSSKEALELAATPRDLVVIGGGVTGLEMGTYFAKMGSRVTVIELLDQILPGTDPEVARIVARNLKRLGVEVHVRSKVVGWAAKGDRIVVTVETPERAIEVDADKVLVSIGRRPNTEGLNLAAAGVKTDEKGFVRADAQMRTNVPHVFAIGDVTGVPFLAHKASKEGIVAAEVAAGQASAADWKALPNAIFTDPEVATVGMDEAQATAKGHEVRVGKVPFAAMGRALAAGETEGFVKVVMDAKSERLLGVQIVGPDASDLISEMALAIEMGATVHDVALTIHPHPTLPEAIMEAAEAALGKAIHVVNRK